jgi:hypothetical protein
MGKFIFIPGATSAARTGHHVGDADAGVKRDLPMSYAGRNPVPSVVTECQYVLFAAALFWGCMLTDFSISSADPVQDRVAPMLARWTGHAGAHAAAPAATHDSEAPQRQAPAPAARPAT